MEEAAKVLVLGVFAALLIAFILRGPQGAKDWWSAKFLGKVSG